MMELALGGEADRKAMEKYLLHPSEVIWNIIL